MSIASAKTFDLVQEEMTDFRSYQDRLPEAKTFYKKFLPKNPDIGLAL
jgi:hypothetical protein